MGRTGLVILLVAATVAGCASRADVSGQPLKGPHQGLAVAWSSDTVAEFTLDHDRQEAVVYVLNRETMQPVPVRAPRVLLTLARPAARVTLLAQPQAGDPAGMASRFAGKMPQPTRGRKFAGSLNATVDGKTWQGDFDQQKDYVRR